MSFLGKIFGKGSAAKLLPGKLEAPTPWPDPPPEAARIETETVASYADRLDKEGKATGNRALRERAARIRANLQ